MLSSQQRDALRTASRSEDLIEAPSQPIETRFKNDGLWLQQTTFPDIGMIAVSELHFSDHIGIVASGRVRVMKDQSFMGIYEAPSMFHAEKGATYTVETLEADTVLYCVVNTDRERSAKGDV